ncbi:hypothetical protein A6U87_01365 [Rhizobium sp. AC44/96]|nr:hypothetical protein A6U87_01365 [Rhizobium sp. AC44/96]
MDLSKNLDRYYNLDWMRGVAAILVVVYHYGSTGQPNLAEHGFIAVDFFFVLSGFVIDRTYSARFGAGLSSFQFMTERFCRLYPLFILGLALGFAKALGAVWIGSHDGLLNPVGSLMFNALFLPSPVSESVIFPLNGPAWSLFLEFWVNVLFAIVLVRLALRSLLAVVLVSAIGFISSSTAVGGLNVGWDWGSLTGGMFRILFAFPLGMIISRIAQWSKVTSLASLVPVAILICMMSLSSWPGQLPFDLTIAILVAPAIVVLGTRYEVPRYLEKTASIFGEISYPMYILHYPLLFVFVPVVHKLGINDDLAMVAFVAGMFALSLALSRAYDRPSRKWLMSRIKIRSQQPA